MFEFSVENFKLINGIKSKLIEHRGIVCLFFNGSLFESNHDLMMVKNYFTDFFNSRPIEQLDPKTLGYFITITALNETKLCFRAYGFSSDCTTKLCLVENGPNFDLVLKKCQIPSDEMVKAASKQPNNLKTKAKNKKNREKDELGVHYGRLRLKQQDLSQLKKSTFKNTIKK